MPFIAMVSRRTNPAKHTQNPAKHTQNPAKLAPFSFTRFSTFHNVLALTTFVLHDIGYVSKPCFDPMRPFMMLLDTVKVTPLNLQLPAVSRPFPSQGGRQSSVWTKQQYTILLIFARRIDLDYSIHHWDMSCLRNPCLNLRKPVENDRIPCNIAIFGAPRITKSG